MNGKVALHTLGCKLNFSETSTIGKQFLTNGFEIVDLKEKADVYVFNSCTVTENAERECRQLVRRVLRKNPEAFVIVTGCYAQLRPEEIGNIYGVDAVLGSNEKFNLFSILNDFNKSELACIHVGSLNNVTDFGEAYSNEGDSRTRAFFKLQDGCDYQCTFCTIPLARGSSRSMDPLSAADEFKRLIDQGYKEIVLTGVNVGDYGKSYDYTFFQLLSDLTKIEGDFRIRISSIEPNLLSNDIINLITEEKKLCNHLHIPLQSGSPQILKAMKRRYSVKDYEKVIIRANENIENLGIGVDVIVGFPGETEKHFIETHNFLRDLPISYLHVFTYSERPNTKAINLPGKVEITERKRRNRLLTILSEKKKHQFYGQMLGKDLDVLFEDELVDNKMKGFTSNYVRVINEYDQSFINKLTSVNLTEITAEGICTGNILDTKNSIELISI
jgi:threonylcarbamoyladenosine tRNA methylthiotransferase MtaB